MAKIQTIKCPWCGRMASFSKSNNLAPHMQSTSVRCWGVGHPRKQVEELRAFMDKEESVKRKK